MEMLTKLSVTVNLCAACTCSRHCLAGDDVALALVCAECSACDLVCVTMHHHWHQCMVLLTERPSANGACLVSAFSHVCTKFGGRRSEGACAVPQVLRGV